MPKTLNPVNAFPTSIPNFPLAGNSEPVAIGPLEAAIQAVLNRTENLHQFRLTVEGAGIKRIQRVASLTALQNLAGMSDGDTVDVEGYGRYRLYNPSALTADGLWILTATGGGRWVHTAYLMRGISNGWAMLNSDGRLAQDVRDNSIVTAHIANGQVTGAKLSPGAAVANIGYIPVNRAGDTMTGQLITTDRVFAHRQFGSGGPAISLAIGDDDTGLNWNSDGVVQIRANGQELAFWNTSEITYKADKRLRFEDGSGKIVFGNNNNQVLAKIHTNSGYFGSEFNSTYSFLQWYLSTGYSQNDISGAFAIPGDILGSNHVAHIHARSDKIYFYTATSGGSTRVYYSQTGIQDNSQFRIEPIQVVLRSRLVPDADNVTNWRLGDSGFRWNSVWAANGTIQTSDARLKTDVEDSPLGLEFIRRLRPVRYRWVEGGKEIIEPEPRKVANEDGEEVLVYDGAPEIKSIPGRRLHYGLIAQEVKGVLEELNAGDFGGWVLSDASDPESTQSLRYDQFIAPLVRAVQELAERLEWLERKVKR